jgi:hypothetical protein
MNLAQGGRTPVFGCAACNLPATLKKLDTVATVNLVFAF